MDPRELTVSEMMGLMVEALRKEAGKAYGYDLWPQGFAQNLCNRLPVQEQHAALVQVSRIAEDAAWELTVRGLLRPGVTHYQAQAVSEGGYSITTFGRAWLQEPHDRSMIVHSPSHVANLLEQVRSRLGEGFFQRAIEAHRCFQARAYLGTCVMCGAAAESILLALAIGKSGDEVMILKDYSAANGRSRIENLLVGQAGDRIKRRVTGLTELMKDWRDEAGHGSFTEISADEAATALDLLLRFAVFADKEWDQIVGRG